MSTGLTRSILLPRRSPVLARPPATHRRAWALGLLWLATLSPSASSRAQARRFVCVPESALVLGPARVEEPSPAAISRLGAPLATRADTVDGADERFLVTRYQYPDFEITVSQASGRVAEIRALTDKVSTLLGIHLGMNRPEVESHFPAGALRKPSIRSGPDSLEGYSCVGHTVLLIFKGSRLSGLLLYGFLPKH